MSGKKINVADPTSVKKQKDLVKTVRDAQLNDIRSTLSHPYARRLIWRLLTQCKTFGSIFNPNNSTMSYNSGQQDIGHFIMSEIGKTDENLLAKLMNENKEKK